MKVAPVIFFLLLIGPTLAEPKAQAKVTDLGDGRSQFGEITFEPDERRISFPATVNMIENVVEYLVVTPAGKKHESVFTTGIDPRHLHMAALLVAGEGEEPPKATVQVAWRLNGPAKVLALSHCLELRDPATGKAVTTAKLPNTWTYTGSRMLGNNLQAASAGNLIALIDDPDALLNSTFPSRDNDELHYPATRRLPPVGTAVTISLTFAPATK